MKWLISLIILLIAPAFTGCDLAVDNSETAGVRACEYVAEGLCIQQENCAEEDAAWEDSDWRKCTVSLAIELQCSLVTGLHKDEYDACLLGIDTDACGGSEIPLICKSAFRFVSE